MGQLLGLSGAAAPTGSYVWLTARRRRDWALRPDLGEIVRKFLVRSAVTMFAVGASVTLAPNYAEAATSALYSDPVYWPLHVQSYIDCTMTNPGCSDHHTFYGVDVIPTGQRSGAPLSQAGVYSMGAGIAHIGNADGTPCGTGTATTFGTWIWVDHGGGVVSRYGHLSKIDITEGQHVNAGQLLGIVGNTGDSSKLYCDENYLDFQVLHDGYHGPSVPFSTKGTGSPDGDLLGCSTGSLQLWPLNLSVGITAIEAMPEKTNVPASSNDCLPRYAAASLPSAPSLSLTARPQGFDQGDLGRPGRRQRRPCRGRPLPPVHQGLRQPVERDVDRPVEVQHQQEHHGAQAQAAVPRAGVVPHRAGLAVANTGVPIHSDQVTTPPPMTAPPLPRRRAVGVSDTGLPMGTEASSQSAFVGP